MSVFADFTCEHCGRRFGGQFDSIEDMEAPACPGCGKQGPKLPERDARKSIGPFPPNPDGYFEARRAAGLAFSQAVRFLKIDRDALMSIEDGTIDPSQEMLRRMTSVYGTKFENEI